MTRCVRDTSREGVIDVWTLHVPVSRSDIRMQCTVCLVGRPECGEHIFQSSSCARNVLLRFHVLRTLWSAGEIRTPSASMCHYQSRFTLPERFSTHGEAVPCAISPSEIRHASLYTYIHARQSYGPRFSSGLSTRSGDLSNGPAPTDIHLAPRTERYIFTLYVTYRKEPGRMPSTPSIAYIE